ncbi:unnamed protein product [Lactuca virosa]|uniref:Uncharacterized protein n=1 Tax=Lactuca virosa TaxID=75947 RepID=A0AAU9MBQ8_9ASTR|nr:unnamed protein product [Lactuca virosa]
MVASNNKENDGIQKCKYEINDAEDEQGSDNVDHGNIEDHICNTSISISTLQDCEDIHLLLILKLILRQNLLSDPQ